MMILRATTRTPRFELVVGRGLSERFRKVSISKASVTRAPNGSCPVRLRIFPPSVHDIRGSETPRSGDRRLKASPPGDASGDYLRRSAIRGPNELR
eukprot:2510440-Pyramimonas_sp.AAC.1